LWRALWLRSVDCRHRSFDEMQASEPARVFTGATCGVGDETLRHHRTRRATLPATAEATDLFLLEELEDVGTTAKLAQSDLGTTPPAMARNQEGHPDGHSLQGFR
jgi:hypothetical protein